MDSNTPFVITISRHYGSAGRLIGQAIANHFGIAYYDKNILSQAAEDTGLGPRVFHNTDNPSIDRKGFIRQFVNAVQPFLGGGDFYSSQLSDESIFTLQSGVIKKLAAEHSCVIVGRAADFILRDHPRHVNIFITANTEDRIRQIMDEKKTEFKVAQKLIKQVDNQRAGYYNFYADTTWAAAETYDLCINTSALGREKSIQFIIDFICSKLHVDPTPDLSPSVPEIF